MKSGVWSDGIAFGDELNKSRISLLLTPNSKLLALHSSLSTLHTSHSTLLPVHRFVEFCFQFRYRLFKSGRYFIDRKVAEAVSRLLSLRRSSFLPLFFPNPKRKTPVSSQTPGFFLTFFDGIV